MKLNKDILLTLIEDGYILVNTNEDQSLMILNYSRTTQFEKFWNEYTLMARGLIIDRSYNVVAMPFPKFFNYEEHKAEEIPTGRFEVYDKMDGSLGILFYHAGEWQIATRGSFVSDQAIRAKEILKKYNVSSLFKDVTYLFEIIYPENRIVVNYGEEEKLVMLGMIRIHENTYSDLSYDYMVAHKMIVDHGIPLVVRYDGLNSIKELKSRNILNQEGYVLRYENGFRMKVKFEDYCRLHSIITNISTKDIWECLRDGKNIDELLDRTPDEFDDWVRGQVTTLKEEFKKIDDMCRYQFEDCHFLDITKKEFAENALKYGKTSAILFKMFDGKPYDNIIWKIVEPKWSKPFFKQDDEE